MGSRVKQPGACKLWVRCIELVQGPPPLLHLLFVLEALLVLHVVVARVDALRCLALHSLALVVLQLLPLVVAIPVELESNL